MFRRLDHHANTFAVRIIIMIVCSGPVAGCNSMGAPWSGSVNGAVTMPVNIDSKYCGPGKTSCNEFENLLVSVRTTKETYRKNYERSADTVGLFDTPLGIVAVTAAGAAIFGGPTDLLKGLGLGAGALVLGRNYVNPKDTALAYLLAEKRLSCVEIRSHVFRDVPDSEGGNSIEDLKSYSQVLPAKRKETEAVIAEYENWVRSVDDLATINAVVFKRAEQTATALRALVVEARTQEVLIEKDLALFEDRLLIVQGAADVIRQTLAVSLLEDRAASFDTSMATLKTVIPQVVGFQLPSGQSESAGEDSVMQDDSKNGTLTKIANDLEKKQGELNQVLQSAADSVQNFPAAVVKLNECTALAM